MSRKSTKHRETLSLLDKETPGIELLTADDIPLIDYELKEDAIFGKQQSNELENIEELDELDITHIYENELELSDDEVEKIKKFEKGLEQNTAKIKGAFKDKDLDPRTKLTIMLNSDVGNDIYKENVNKIYRYLEEDEKTEKALEKEIEKMAEYVQKHFK